MNGRTPSSGTDEGVGSADARRAADDILAKQADLFAVTRSTEFGRLGSLEFGEPADRVSVNDSVAVAHRRVAQTVGAESWLKLADEFIRRQVELRRDFTADDIITAVGPAPNVNAAAVAIRRAKLAGLIVVSGFTSSTRPEARGHGIRVWGPR